jgi:hypothetical protein
MGQLRLMENKVVSHPTLYPTLIIDLQYWSFMFRLDKRSLTKQNSLLFNGHNCYTSSHHVEQPTPLEELQRCEEDAGGGSTAQCSAAVFLTR